MARDEFPILFIIPSGIGCSVGGFAGDGMPAARLLASASGCLITHPNVMNGGSLYWPDRRIQYVEGYSLDKFSSGELLLKPVRQQTVGLLLDAGIENDLKQRNLQAAEGCKASLGLNIGPCVYTEKPLGVNLEKGSSGASWGSITEPDVLLRAGEKLKKAGATAIAVVTRFPDELENLDTELYQQGNGVDAIAGAEAIISHLLVKHLLIPCAHAPALSPLPINPNLDPRAAGEEIGYTFLTSVLVGLSTAPDLIAIKNLNGNQKRLLSLNSLMIEDIGAVVVPEGALGGESVLACIERSIPIISVKNPCVTKIHSNELGLKISNHDQKFLTAMNYIEAAGFIVALREGIHICSTQRPIKKIHNVM